MSTGDGAMRRENAVRGQAEAIQEALREVRAFDPHCHLRAARPAADDLADIVLYHHVWIELVSAGMDRFAATKAGLPHELQDPGMAPLERVRQCLPYLPRIRNTTVGLCLRWILQDLYGLEGDLNERNLEKAFRTVEGRARAATWNEHLMRERCGIEASITVEPGPPGAERVHRAREWAPVNLVSGKASPREVLESLEQEFGRPIRSAEDYCEHLASGARKLDAENLRFLGLWLLPWISPERSRPEDVAPVLQKAAAGEPLSRAESGGFCYYGVCRLLEELRRGPLRTVQVIVGAEVLPPHRSIPCWSGEFAGALARIAGQFEDFHFNLSSASDLYTQDLGILAKHVPNISVAGHWWHTLYPHYIRKAVETRIDMVPMNKIVAFFSDAYRSEWCYPKLKLVKTIWGEVLEERVAKGWCEVDTAVDLVRAAFYENPARIYGGP